MLESEVLAVLTGAASSAASPRFHRNAAHADSQATQRLKIDDDVRGRKPLKGQSPIILLMLLARLNSLLKKSHWSHFFSTAS
jgi:hypothetical protein